MDNEKKMRSLAADLRSCGEYLSGLAAEVERMLPDQEMEPQASAKVEKDDPPIKLEDVRAVLAGISRAGHTDEVRHLIEKHGADRLSKVDPARYQELLRDAEALHAD